MSDAARQNLKVSREGIVLIKSFEGFRPRAIQRAEGGWIIGYGHTLSAREGASVSEADAELLLRYDLLPVEKTLNETVPADLNQHQFDALVSFAFSVGVDRFAGSDVRQRLTAGSPGEAADAMMGWPEPALPETALRRRAAERALFVANPEAPVALSDLLAAPLPPPAVVAPQDAPQEKSQPEVAPTVDAAPAPVTETPAVDPRGAAVAALLGEPAARLVQADESQGPIIPTFAPAEAVSVEAAEAPPAPSNDNPTTEPAVDFDPAPEAEIPATEPVEDEIVASNDTADTPPLEPSTPDEPVAEPAAEVEAAQEPTFAAPQVDPVVLNASRYTPYAAAMVGPLPFLQPATPREETGRTEAPAIDHSVVEATLPDLAEATPQDDVTTVAAALVEPLVLAPVQSFSVDPAPVAELILTPLEDAPEPAFERPLWTPEQRDAPDGSETNLFGEDLTLTGGGSIMRHEIEFEAPAKFDWSETGPFIFMGGVGLVSFGASMAAFRRAAEQSGGSELTIIGWVLAVIGLACVGVSSINLYRKFGLPGGD